MRIDSKKKYFEERLQQRIMSLIFLFHIYFVKEYIFHFPGNIHHYFIHFPLNDIKIDRIIRDENHL